MELNIIYGLVAAAVYFGGYSVYRKLRYRYLLSQRRRRNQAADLSRLRPSGGVPVMDYINLNTGGHE